MQCDTYENRIDFLMEKLPLDISHSKAYQKQTAISLYDRIQAINTYTKSYHKIASKVHLFKATVPTVTEIEEDYRLSELCHQPVDVRSFEGDHVSILDNPQLAVAVNDTLSESFDKQTTFLNIEKVVEVSEALRQ